METKFFAAAGTKRLAPGLYLDADGQAHLMIPELLDHFGYADTPENRDVCTKAALQVAREAGINAQETD